MINKNTLQEVIDDQREDMADVEVMPRDVEFEENGNYVFVGLRRAGKSYLLFQRIQQLMAQGLGWNGIEYVNFEDERLREMTADDLNLVLEVHYSRYDTKPVMFLDEIQVVPGWERFVRRLADSHYRVYVTGSNSTMLSEEIYSTLGGRFLVQEVYPYSFAEYLRANGVKGTGGTRQKGEVRRTFAGYLSYGGLPEVCLFKQKRSWLQGLYQKVFLNDMVARNKIRNAGAASLMLKKLAESTGQPLSYTRIAGVVSAAGNKTETRSIIDYVGYAEASWLILPVSNYAAKLAQKESNRKYYFIDNGLLNLFLISGEAALLENIVAVELHRRYGREAVYYYQQGIEMDFYVPDEGLAVQVCRTLAEVGTTERELEPFARFAGFLHPRRMLIITLDDEGLLTVKEQNIEVIPCWKWLVTG